MHAIGRLGNRYVLLDGMRGIAAITVLIYHLAWQVRLQDALFSHAYLAVDFFFMLSGFVIAEAYICKLRTGTLSPGAFVAARIIRLYPMIAFGSLVGLFFVVGAIALGGSTWTNALALEAAAASLVLEPYVLQPDVVGLRFGFPLNEPLWSLFWEMAANLVFVCLVGSRLAGARTWAVLTALFAPALMVFALQHNGLDRGHHEMLGGFLRVGYAFPLGIVVWYYRASIARLAVPIAVQVIVLALVFACPRPPHVNALVDIAAVIVIFPLLLAAASQSDVQGRAGGWSLWLGAISYPLYAFHDPIMMAVQDFGTDFGRLASLGFILGSAILIIWLSWLVLKYVDEPIRAWLRGKRAVVRVKAQTAP